MAREYGSSPRSRSVGRVLGRPVETGDPAVDEPVRDVAPDLLRADQEQVEFGVVRGRPVAAGRNVDAVAGLAEQLDGRFLEAALRDGEFQGFG